MQDISQGTEGVRIEKYSAEQVAQSTAIVGREPTADELRAHHPAPADGVWTAGHEDDEATQEAGQ